MVWRQDARNRQPLPPLLASAGTSRIGTSNRLPDTDRVMEPDDSILWARSRSGDLAELAALFERHANAIYNYCFRRVGDWSTAEDRLSVVFLEAWRRRKKELPPDKAVRNRDERRPEPAAPANVTGSRASRQPTTSSTGCSCATARTSCG